LPLESVQVVVLTVDVPDCLTASFAAVIEQLFCGSTNTTEEPDALMPFSLLDVTNILLSKGFCVIERVTDELS